MEEVIKSHNDIFKSDIPRNLTNIIEVDMAEIKNNNIEILEEIKKENVNLYNSDQIEIDEMNNIEINDEEKTEKQSHKKGNIIFE